MTREQLGDHLAALSQTYFGEQLNNGRRPPPQMIEDMLDLADEYADSRHAKQIGAERPARTPRRRPTP